MSEIVLTNASATSPIKSVFSLLITGTLGGFTAFGLFILMQVLIEQGDITLEDKETFRIVDPVMPPEEIEQLVDALEPEAPPDVTPPDIDVPVDSSDTDVVSLSAPITSESVDFDLGSEAIAPPGGSEMLPIIRSNPNYPERAAVRGIEGWVLVEFTVNEEGRVTKPRVVSSHPSSIFNSSALRAIKKWRYKPRLEEGIAIPVEGVQFRFKFQLAG